MLYDSYLNHYVGFCRAKAGALTALTLGLAACGGLSDSADDSDSASYFSMSKAERVQSVQVSNPLTEIHLDDVPHFAQKLDRILDLAEDLDHLFYTRSAMEGDPQTFDIGLVECNLSGEADLAFSNENTVFTALYDDCNGLFSIRHRYQYANGGERITWVEGGDGNTSVMQEFDRFVLGTGDDQRELNGVIELTYDIDRMLPRKIVMNLSVVGAEYGSTTVNNLVIELEPHTISPMREEIQSIEGVIEVEDVGIAKLSTTVRNRVAYSPLRILIEGEGPSKGTFEFEQNYLLGFDEDGDGQTDRSLRFYLPINFELFEFGQSPLSAPILISGLSYIEGERLMGEVNAFDVNPNFRDANGRLLRFEAALVKVLNILDISGEGQDITGDAIIDYELEQTDSGYFLFTSHTPLERVEYQFEITAYGEDEEPHEDTVLISVEAYRDSDGDRSPD